MEISEEEREKELNRAKDEAKSIWDKFMNLRSEIILFKSKNEINFNIVKKNYDKFLQELDDLLSAIRFRDINSNVYLQYENIRLKIQIINNERNILKKFFYIRIFNIINNLTKNERFHESLEVIEELENNFPIDQIDFYDDDKKKYIQSLNKIKNHCEIMVKHNEALKIFNEENCDEKNFQKSIKLLQDLLYESKNDSQKEYFNKEIRNIKIKYLMSITKKNMQLYYSKNYDEIIEESEKIFSKFNDINLSATLHEMKVVYSMALKEKILIKIKKGENYEEEYSKYDTVTDLEKLDNELKNLIHKK